MPRFAIWKNSPDKFLKIWKNAASFIHESMRPITRILLLAVLLLPLPASAFTDTDAKAVIRLVEQGVIEDKTRFLPEIPCAKAVFVEWSLKNIDERPAGKPFTEPFIDVNPTDAYAPYAARALELGAVKNSPLFQPQKPVTRLEALRIALQLEGLAMPVGGFDLPAYADLPKDAASRGVIKKALDLGIISPQSEKLFGTYAPLNRLQCAELLDAISLSRKGEREITIEIGGKPRNGKDTTFDQVMHALKTKYLYADKVDTAKLEAQAVREAVASLEDPYTVFFDEQEVQDFLLGVGVGTQYGIGAQVGLDKDNKPMIMKPLRGSPAEKAGLKPGDIILKVDGTDVSAGDRKLEEVADLIKGDEGTPVNIEFLRNGKPFQLDIVRARIEVESLFASEHDGYLLIEMHFFGNDSAEKILDAVAEFPQAAKKGIILDLRDNPGGFLDSAVKVLGLFLPPDSVAVKTRGKDFLHTEKTKGAADLVGTPLIVIVNERSASASEILAGALQDHKRAAIIGQTTFGKGSAQELLQFEDGTALKVTIAEWLTPDDRSIEGTGITPDTVIADLEASEAVWDQAARMIGRGQWKPAK